MRKNSVLLELSFSSDPVFQADTVITQCCNVNLNRIGIKMVVYVKTGDNSDEWCCVYGKKALISEEPSGIPHFLRIGA